MMGGETDPVVTSQNVLVFSKRLQLTQWAAPLSVALLSALYELVLAQVVIRSFGVATLSIAGVVIYSMIGPLVLWLWLAYANRGLTHETQHDQAQHRLASVLAASGEAIIVLDGQGLIQSWNWGAEQIFGYPPNEILKRHFSWLIGAGQAQQIEANWLIETTQKTGWLRNYDTECVHKDGQHIAVEITATHPATEAGLVLVMRDVTEQRRHAEAIQELNNNLQRVVAERTRDLASKVTELRQANQQLEELDRLKSEFVSLVSHQLRAPLTNIGGALELIQNRCDLMNPTCQQIQPVISQQMGRLQRMVQDVLNVSRFEADGIGVDPKPVSLPPLIERIVDEVSASDGRARFKLPYKPMLPPVLADADRLAEVITNLLDNAIKYSPAGTPIRIDLAADTQFVTVSICDQGYGIPEGEVERVFDKFHRIDGSDAQRVYGYGLGLYICRKLVELHGGQIWASRNAPGQGTTVAFTLPLGV